MRGRLGGGTRGSVVAFASASALAIAVATGAAACGGSSADTPDPGADAAPDAGPGVESGATDPDAAPVADTGTDSGPPPRADAGPGCASLSPPARFCDDFDDGDVADDWTIANVLNGSTLELDTTAGFVSAPASMRVTTKALAAMSTAPAHLRHTVFGAASHPSLSFWAFFTTSPVITKGAVAIATLDVTTSHFFTLWLRDDPQDGSEPAAVLEEINGASITRTPLTKLPPMGAWTRVVIDLDLVAGKANVFFDADKAVDGAPIAAAPGTEATIRVGAVYLFGPADPLQASFDDVIVDY